MAKLPQYGLAPFRVRRESDGFIFNRIWAAIKRECLMVVEEGVAPPEDIDAMWRIFTAPGIPPFRLMDRVGLDVVLAIEEHYADVRDGLPEGPRTAAAPVRRRGPARGQERRAASTSTPPESGGRPGWPRSSRQGRSGSFAEVAPRSRSQLTRFSWRVPREFAASSGVPSA